MSCHLRVYYRVVGGHVHCRVFSGPAAHLTHGKNGDLVFDLREWPAAREALARIADVKEED